MSSVRQYEPYAAQLGFLSESIHRVLTERECGIFDRGLADYHRRKNIKAFVECLSLVLNTNHKRQLLIPIRDTYVKPSDTGRFNQLVQAHGLATSLKKKRREQLEGGGGGKGGGQDGIHRADVKRDPGGEWGFNIRGGSDQGTGVFVSWVEPESNAHRNGLQVGDQILKANETSFENINHHDAVQLIRGCKRLRLWLLSHGRVPTTRLAHKVYRWVDPEGRETTPPPDPFTIAEQRARGDYTFGSEVDERKVTVMVDSGKELGISIRGGSEHGLGIYISKVDEASVAEAYGLKVGDQILEVNRMSFLNIVHADAARALRAKPCMVIRVKDVGKLPHSRITTYSQTQWHSEKQREKKDGTRGKKAFQKGAGTQVMLRKYETGIQSRGMMNEVARSVLSSQELSTFTYYIEQYHQRGLSVEDLTTALLELLDTPEKLQLLGEVRGILRVMDLDRYNELTVHHEIAAKKAGRKGGLGSVGESQSRLVSRDGSGLIAGSSSQPYTAHQTIAEVHQEGPGALQSCLSPPAASDMSFSSADNTLTLEEDVDFGGRDQVPQRMSPVARKPPVTGTPVFHAPPPPPTSEPATSTPDAGGQPQTALAEGLKERRQRMRPGLSDQSTMEDEEGVWDSQFSAGPSLSTIRSPQEAVSVVSLPEIEARIQQEVEDKMKRDFEEKERQLQEEHLRKLEQEKQEKEDQIRREREALERQLAEMEQRTAAEVEARVRREAEQEMRHQVEERERLMAEKMERLAMEQQEERESHRGEEAERLKMELEERIWKEAEESMRHEFESRMQQERQNLHQQSEELRVAALEEAEKQLQSQLEEKYREQFEARLEEERERLRERECEEQQRKNTLERQKQQEDVERMEAEEQAKIDLEEKIRRETEAAVRAEYEARLQFETEQRAKLAEEVKAHKELEQRLEEEREALERDREREREEREQTQQRQREESEMQRAKEQKQKEEIEREMKHAREQKQKEEIEREMKHAREQKQREEREQQKQEQRERGQRERERKLERQREEEKREREAVTEKRRRRGVNERQKLAMERQQKEREEEEQRRNMQWQVQEEHDGGEGQTEEDEEAEKLLKLQRQQAEQQQREEEEETHRQEEAERREREAAQAQKQSEAQHRKELERKREENIRRREEEQQRREQEQRLRLEGQKKQREEEEKRRIQEEVERAMAGKKTTRAQQIAVKFGDESEAAVQQRQRDRDQVLVTQQLVEEERRKAEEKLQRRVDRFKAQQQRQNVTSDPPGTASDHMPSSEKGEGKSYAGYTDLHGEIVTVTVTKVCKKLGIAIDGGANTKQKAVIIREISPEGCAAKTATPPLRLGQQILQVENTSLYGLRHKETVMAIKGAFEGPLNKTLTFVVLDRQGEDDEQDTDSELTLTQETAPTPDHFLDSLPELGMTKSPVSHKSHAKSKRQAEVEQHMRVKDLVPERGLRPSYDKLPPEVEQHMREKDHFLELIPERGLRPSYDKLPPEVEQHMREKDSIPELGLPPSPLHHDEPRVQLRKKKRPPEVEQRMREKGLDEFIVEASHDLPSRHQPPAPPPSASAAGPPRETGVSFGGYTNLRGEILTIPVQKVNKKLGMAIDGGANTKQVAVTIRQITPDGSAALSGEGLKVGQQILQVNSRSLHGLSHKDAVSTIKSGFEGPINKTTITFIVLDPE